MEGSFDGIGIEFNLIDDTILVIAPISGGPSQVLASFQEIKLFVLTVILLQESD